MKAPERRQLVNECRKKGDMKISFGGKHHPMMRNSASNLRNLMVAIALCIARTSLTPDSAPPFVCKQRHDAPRRIDGPHAARRPDLDGACHSSRGAAAAANKGASATHSDPQVRTRQHAPRAPQQPLTRAVWLCVRPVACSSLTPRRARRCANAEARRRRLNTL